MKPTEFIMSLKDLQEKAKKAFGHPETLPPGELFCPACKKTYKPTYPTKAEAFLTNDKTAREQWITGICSDKCWNEFLGVDE